MRASPTLTLRGLAQSKPPANPYQQYVSKQLAKSRQTVPTIAEQPSLNFVTKSFYLPSLDTEYKLKVTERVLLRIERDGIESFLFDESPDALGPTGLKLQEALRQRRDGAAKELEKAREMPSSEVDGRGPTASVAPAIHAQPIASTSAVTLDAAARVDISSARSTPTWLEERQRDEVEVGESRLMEQERARERPALSPSTRAALQKRYGSPSHRRLSPSAVLLWHTVQQIKAYDNAHGGYCLACLISKHSTETCSVLPDFDDEEAFYDLHSPATKPQGRPICFSFHLYGICENGCPSSDVGACTACGDSHPTHEHLARSSTRPRLPTVLPAWPLPLPPLVTTRMSRQKRLRVQEEREEAEDRRNTILKRLFDRYERRAEAERAAQVAWEAGGRPSLDSLAIVAGREAAGVDAGAVRARIPDEPFLQSLRRRADKPAYFKSIYSARAAIALLEPTLLPSTRLYASMKPSDVCHAFKRARIPPPRWHYADKGLYHGVRPHKYWEVITPKLPGWKLTKQRRWRRPNAALHRWFFPTLDQAFSIKTSTTAVRQIDRAGGVEPYLFRTPIDKLGVVGLKLRNKVKAVVEKRKAQHLIDTKAAFLKQHPKPALPPLKPIPAHPVVVWDWLQEAEGVGLTNSCIRCGRQGHLFDACDAKDTILEAEAYTERVADRHSTDATALEGASPICVPYHSLGACETCTTTEERGTCLICGTDHPAYEHIAPKLDLRLRPGAISPVADMDYDPDADEPKLPELDEIDKGKQDKGKRRATVEELLAEEEEYAQHYEGVRDQEAWARYSAYQWEQAGRPALPKGVAMDELDLSRSMRSLSLAQHLDADLKKRRRWRLSDKLARPAVAAVSC